MATAEDEIGKLYVPVELDLGPMERQARTELRAGAEKAGADFSTTMQQTFRKYFGNNNQQAQDAGVQLAKQLKAGLRREMADIREMKFREIISKEDAERMGREAGERFNKGLLDGMERLGGQGKLSDRGFIALSESLKETGQKGGRALGDGIDREARSGIDRFTTYARTAFGLLFGGALIYMLRRAGTAISDFLVQGGNAATTRAGFDALTASIGQTSEAILNGLRRATRGLVADSELMVRANTAIQAKLPATAEQLERLAYVSRRLAEAQGRDATEGFQRMVNGIAKGEQAILEELGLMTRLTDVLKDWERQTGKNSDSLTQQEKILLMYNAVVTEAEAKVRDLGEESINAGTRVEQFRTFIGNVTDEVARLVANSPTLLGMFGNVADEAQNSADRIQNLAIQLAAFIETALQAPSIIKNATLTNPADWRGTYERNKARITVDVNNERQIQQIRGMQDINKLLEYRVRLVTKLNAIQGVSPQAVENRERLGVGLTAVDRRIEQLRNPPPPRTETGGGTTAAQRAKAEAAARKAEAARQKARRETEQHAERIQRATDEMERALAGLTRDTGQQALVQLAKIEREAVETFRKAGQKMPEAMAAGFRERRTALEGLIRLEDFQQRGEDLTRATGQGGGTFAQRSELHAMIEAMEAEAAQLPQNSKLREQYTDTIHRFRQAYERAVDVVVKGAEDEADAERKALDQAIRTREERLRATQQLAREIEGAVRGTIQLAEAFGMVDSEAAAALQRIGQLAAAVVNISGALKAGGGLSGFTSAGGIGAVLSALGAVAGMIKSVMGPSRAELTRQEQERVRALVENTRALREFRDAALRNVSEAERQAIAGPIQTLLARVDAMGILAPRSVAATDPATVEAVQRLARITGATDLFTETGRINVEALRRALQAFLDQAIGGFGQDLAGRLDAINYLFNTLGDAAGTTADRLAMVLDALRALGNTDLADQINTLWQQGPEAVRAWMEQMTRAYAANDWATINAAFGGNIRPEDFERIMGELRALLEAGGAGGATNNVGIVRSVTELTANRLLGYAATQTHWLELIARSNAAIAQVLGAGAFELPQIHLPTPEQVGGGTTASAGTHYNFGPGSVNITVPASGDPYATGRDVGRGFRDGVQGVAGTDEALGRRTIDVRRARGLLTRTTG